MRTLVLALSLAAGLMLAPSAAAKGELIAVEVCGSSGCRTVEDERTLRGVAAMGYLRLFDARTGAPSEAPDEWVPIDLRSAEPTPWTEGAHELLYSPDANAIDRSGVFFEVPDWLAADVEAARPTGREQGLPWPTVLLGLLAATGLASLPCVPRGRK